MSNSIEDNILLSKKMQIALLQNVYFKINIDQDPTKFSIEINIKLFGIISQVFDSFEPFSESDAEDDAIYNNCRKTVSKNSDRLQLTATRCSLADMRSNESLL